MAARKRNKKRIPETGATESPEPQLDLFFGETAAGVSSTCSTKYYFSTQLGNLIGALAHEMVGTRPLDFFAQAPVIWVPNRNLRRWIQMELAQRTGVAAHLDFQFLESGLWDLLVALDPEDETPQPLDRTDLEYLVLSVLQEILTPGAQVTEDSQRPDEVFAPFLDYLRVQTGAESGGARQLYQLALRLAALFQEYEYHRGAMIAAWSEVPGLSTAAESIPEDPERRKIYFAQRALYRRIFGVGSSREGGRILALDRFGNRALSLSAYARAVLIERRERLKPLDRTVHIFGMSQMSAFHLALLGELSEYLDLRMYLPFVPEHWRLALSAPVAAGPEEAVSIASDSESATNWREVRVEAEFPATSRETPVAGPGAIDVAARLNDLWGRPALELLQLLALNRRGHHRFFWDEVDWLRMRNGVEEPAQSASVLNALQQELLYGDAGSAAMDANPVNQEKSLAQVRVQDASVQIIGCPGLRREAETIYQNILFNMRRDASLRLTEIAILVPDMQVYRPVLQAVFDADRDNRSGRLRVPYNLSDFSAGDASVYSAGVAAILALADSEFTRKDLFGLFLNPCFLSAHRLEREQVLAWLQWADELKIFRGLDAEHQAELGIAPDNRFTWGRALERLRLGTVMTTPNDPGDFRHYGPLIPYSDLATGESSLIGMLSAVCIDLHVSLRECEACFPRNEYRGLDVVRELLDRHLQPPADRAGEAGVRAEVFSTIHRLGRHASATGRLPSFGMLREILSSSIGGVAGNRGNYLAGGVTIAALQPMRPIPFRIVYVPGMGEGDFPGHPDLSVLNLRNLERRIGDASMPESNRLLFLENFLSVRDRLYITYVNRDIQRDTDYHPCSVVTELKTGLSEFCSGDVSTEYREARVPLRLTGESHLFFEPNDESDALACYSTPDRVLALRQFLRRNPGLSPENQKILAQLAALQSRQIMDLQPPTGSASDTPAASQNTSEGVPDSIYLRDLLEFLKDPIGALLRRRLGLYDDSDARRRALEDDELFFVPARGRRRFLREALEFQIRNALPDMPDQSVYEDFFEDALRRDQLPRGAFAKLEHSTLGREFEERRTRINQACEDVVWLPELRIGSGDRSMATAGSRPPLHTSAWRARSESEAAITQPEIHGSLRNWFVRKKAELRPGVMTLSFASTIRTEDFLSGFLSALLFKALASSGLDLPAPFAEYKDRPCEVLVIARGETRSIFVDVRPEESAQFLRELALDFQTGRFENLPLRLIEHRSVSRRPHAPSSEAGRSPGARAAAIPRSGLSYAEELRMAWEDNPDDFYQMELARLLPPRFPEDSEEIVRRRYRLFFDCIAAGAREKETPTAVQVQPKGGAL